MKKDLIENLCEKRQSISVQTILLLGKKKGILWLSKKIMIIAVYLFFNLIVRDSMSQH